MPELVLALESIMPATSNSAGAKKPRKKPRPPQQISEETWQAVQGVICAGAMGFTAAGRHFGIEPHAIMARARRNRWPTPSMIAKRAETLHHGRSRAHQEQRNGNEEVIEIAAQSWAQRGEEHRNLVYNLTNRALKKVSNEPPPLESWADVERADKAGRRSCGLDNEENTRVSLALELVNQRIESYYQNTPKDAEGPKELEPSVKQLQPPAPHPPRP